MTLGQVKVEDHSNEITAIPALLELIDIKGAMMSLALNSNPELGDSKRAGLVPGSSLAIALGQE